MEEKFMPWRTITARTIRRGHFWIPGERLNVGGETYQRGPMFVEWEANAELRTAAVAYRSSGSS